MKKRILSTLLALCMAFLLLPMEALATESISNFKKVNTYRTGQFTDVTSGAWYAEGVKSAYELGLIEWNQRQPF